MPAPKPNLMEAEIKALIDAADGLFGAEKLAAAMVEAIGIKRAQQLIAMRKAIAWSKADTEAVALALWPIVPGATAKAKRKAITAAVRPCFATRARYAEVMEYVLEKIEELLAAPSVVVPSAGSIPAWDACTLASCWNGKNASQRMMNILSPAFTDAKFAQYRDWMLSIGCNTAHLFLSNKADGEGGGYCIYGQSWSWTVNKAFCDIFLARIADLRAHGFAVVPWLFADDSGAWNKEAAKDFPRYLADLKAAGLLDQSSIVVDGLELDEYYQSSQVSTLANAIRKVWTGKVGTHQTSGRFDYAALADIVFYQVNPGKSAAQIKAEAQKVVKATGKPLCFFELDRQPNRALCDAALAGGAYAVGNWKGDAVSASVPASGFPAELSSIQWLHSSVRDWPQTATITGAKIANGHIQFPYDKADVWPVASSGTGNGTNANVWAIVQLGCKWYAGTWEWLRKGQTSKPVGCLDGSKGDHFKVSPLNGWRPKSGEEFYLMVSGHARSTGRNVKERSNPVKVRWP